MNIIEIASKPKTKDSSALIHISIDNKEYMLLSTGTSVNVVAGKLWIDSRRTIGKCFHNINDIATHYKKHGNLLIQYAKTVVQLAKS